MTVRSWRVHLTVVGFSFGLLAMGMLRYLESGWATPGYVAITIFSAMALQRYGVPLHRFGFAQGLKLRMILLALLGIAFLQFLNQYLYPLIEEGLGVERDLQRFTEVAGNVPALMTLLLFSWTFAAFGEELAYRVVLFRGIAFALGDSRLATWVALIIQALIFGIAHAYQGPVGVISATASGLVFGALIVSCRGSIWPAAIAHGGNNTIGIATLYLTAG
jgi:membrane protease YdiL (CAAX protease family)